MAGDVNSDGYADIIVGVLSAEPNGSLSRASYVVFGKAIEWKSLRWPNIRSLRQHSR